MDKEEAFVHKVTTKIAIVLQQGKLSEIDGTYDASLVDGCKQQCREYLKMVTERRSDLLPSRISLEAAKKAYSGSHFD